MKYLLLLFVIYLYSCGNDKKLEINEKEVVKEIDFDLLFINDFNPDLDNSEFFQKNMAKKQIKEQERLEVIKTILDSGTNIDTINKNENSILFLSTKFGFYEISKYLIDRGANINSNYEKFDDGSASPLFIALVNCNYKQHRDIAKLLINNGANKNLKIHNMTPLEFLNDKINSGNSECSELIQYFK